MTSRIALLALVLAWLIPGAARAAPMYTDFATIRATAPLIAIGTVQVAAGPNNTVAITVDVEKMLRGKAPRGPMSVKDSPDGHVTVGPERLVAFIDGNGALRWVGKLVAGPSLETGVILLHGFFDFNAHIVHPGLMTLAQLQALLATGQLDQTFDATLAFRDGHGGVARSSRALTVEWSPVTRTLAVPTALPACLGAQSLSGLEWGRFDLLLSDSCPSAAPNARSRSLDLEGRYTGVDANTGRIQVELVPTRPFLTEAEYATFAADSGVATMMNVVSVALSDRTTWTWQLETDLADASGKAHAAGGFSMSSQTVNGAIVSRDEYDFDGGIKILISPGAQSASPGGNARAIATLVDSGQALSCTLKQPGHADRACTLTARPSVVVRR